MITGSVFAQGFLFGIETIVYSFLVFLLYSFYRGFGRRYVKYWILSIVFLCIQYGLLTLQQLLYEYTETDIIQVLLTCFIQISQYLFLFLFCIGTYFTKSGNQVSSSIVCFCIISIVIIGAATSTWFAYDELNVFNRFYLRESLAEFSFGAAFLTNGLMLLSAKRLHFPSKLLMAFSFILALRFIVFSFISVALLTEPWFLQLFDLLIYFDFGANIALGFIMLLWIQGAERNVTLRAINHAQYLGKHDQLTGALNRKKLLEKLPVVIESAVVNKVRIAVFLIDIKGFKYINDTFGLKAGDDILGEIANRLTESILLPQVVGRLSGDSFIYAIEINDDNQQEKAVSHLHDLISRPYYIAHEDVHIQGRIGYCIAPTDGTDEEDLLQKANLALLQAASHNVNSVKYVVGMQTYDSHLHEVEKEIRRALANNELVLYFQPQLNLMTNRIEGAEALVRWQHPEKGILAPIDFLDDFDALGLNGELDNYVLELACKTNVKWYEKFNRRVTIAVNITAVEFQDPKLITKMQNLLVKYQIPSSSIELEITENIMITDLKVAMNTIVVLQNMGIKVSIDDFGTGYSSLAYLRNLPIDKIKIDRSFITDFANNDSDLVIVKSMIKLSHGLGKRVLAEGVESIEQLDLLRTLGCDAVQGYFIDRPLSESHFTKYLSRR